MPQMESAYEHRHDDMLQEVRDMGVRWVARSRNFPKCENRSSRSAAQIIADVLKSHRVQDVVDSEAERRGWPREAVLDEASTIVNQMAHSMSLNSIRCIGYALGHVLQRLYRRIDTNAEQWSRVRHLCEENRVVFMPMHRSYMDFLLVSYLCFGFQVPMPTIAAGMDFLGMRFLGEMLRQCGAFFIRREFGDDYLYWAVFTEYVQSHIKNGDHPLEFFLEGTRSRTGKSLHPKFGLLTALLEPFFRSQVYDICIVPIAMSYDRLLESSLYAYEMQGSKKPPESTSGLFAAASILREDFGVVSVTVGEPISVREYFIRSSLSRHVHALEPNLHFNLRDNEIREIKRLGHYIIKVQQHIQRVTLGPLLCFALTRHSTYIESSWPVQLIKERVRDLYKLCKVLAKPVYIEKSIDEDFDNYLKLQYIWIIRDKETLRLNYSNASESIIRLALCNYANSSVHCFYTCGLSLLSIHSNATLNQSNEFSNTDRENQLVLPYLPVFSHLRTIFAFELISVPGDEVNNLHQAVNQMHQAGIIDIAGERLACNDSTRRQQMILMRSVYVYIQAYLEIYNFILDINNSASLTDAAIFAHMHNVRKRHPTTHGGEMTSIDMIRNAVRALKHVGITTRQNDALILVDGGRLRHYIEILTECKNICCEVEIRCHL